VVVFSSSAARRNASRRSRRAVIVLNCGSGGSRSAIAVSCCHAHHSVDCGAVSRTPTDASMQRAASMST
jgi:hypothetical protein